MPNIHEIIGFEALLGLIEDVANGIPDVPLPPGFFTLTEPVEANRGNFVVSQGTRQTSKIVRFGSPSQSRERAGLDNRQVTLIHTKENEKHGEEVLIQLRDFDSPRRQELGRMEIDRQMAIFLMRFQNLRTASVHSMLSRGKISVDGSQNLIPTDTGAEVIIDMQVPDDHKNQADTILDTSWDDPTADIVGQIEDLQVKSAEDTGMLLSHAIYGSNVLGNLIANNQIGEFLKADGGLSTSFGKLKIPDGFLEMTWWSGSKALYAQDDGTIFKWFDPDALVLMPDVSPMWYAMLEGTSAVPTDLGSVMDDPLGSIANLQEVRGPFSYARVTDDPVGIKHIAGDTFLPVSKVPAALFILNTVF